MYREILLISLVVEEQWVELIRVEIFVAHFVFPSVIHDHIFGFFCFSPRGIANCLILDQKMSSVVE